MDKKRRKELIITSMFILVALLGGISSFVSTTLVQGVILALVSLFSLVCGIASINMVRRIE